MDESEVAVYSINAVSGITGVPASTLRFWERRYGLLSPTRTDGGHRVYSREDVERVKWLRERIDADGLQPRAAHELLAAEIARQGGIAQTVDLRGAIMILVAEKDPVTAELERHFLCERGFDVLIVRDGKKAIVEAEEKQPDLILLDVILPGMNGLKVCEQLKSNQRTARIPVIVLSILDVRDRALESGADAFVLKPLEAERLIEQVEAMLVGDRPKDA